MLRLDAVVLREREVVVRNDGDLVRIQVEEAADGVAATVRQSCIDGRRHAERTVVAWTQVEIVGDAEVAEPAAEVADVHRQPALQFMLHARRELPLIRPRAPPVEHLGVVVEAQRRTAEVRVRHGAAQVAAAWV